MSQKPPLRNRRNRPLLLGSERRRRPRPKERSLKRSIMAVDSLCLRRLRRSDPYPCLHPLLLLLLLLLLPLPLRKDNPRIAKG